MQVISNLVASLSRDFIMHQSGRMQAQPVHLIGLNVEFAHLIARGNNVIVQNLPTEILK